MILLLKLKLYFTAIFLLSTSLEASHCRLPERLIEWANQQISPESNLYLASKFGSQQAGEQLLALALETEQAHWLYMLAEQGSPRAHYELALLAERPSLKNQHLVKAAVSDYAPALFELGIANARPEIRIQYLTRAANQDYFAAKKALYQWHWFHEDYQQGLPWLEEVAKTDNESALTLALFLWRGGQHEEAIGWLENAQSLGNSEARTYQSLISNYWQKAVQPDTTNNKPNSCSMRIQFVANSLDSIKQANNYYKEFNRDERFEGMPICLNKPLWVQHEDFICDSRATNNYRITCSLAHLDGVLEPEDFTHIAVFAEQGKANVVNGVMFLDLADKYSVFIHELAHFVGFIDEYPLSSEFAGYFCSVFRDFPNIVIVPENGTLDDIDLEYWQTRSDGLSLARANTCNNHPAQAYKFSSKLTFMEFHDTDFIPQIYLDIWKERLQDRTLIRTAAMNIAQSLEEVGNTPAAEKWWKAFDEWRNQPAEPTNPSLLPQQTLR